MELQFFCCTTLILVWVGRDMGSASAAWWNSWQIFDESTKMKLLLWLSTTKTCGVWVIMFHAIVILAVDGGDWPAWRPALYLQGKNRIERRVGRHESQSAVLVGVVQTNVFTHMPKFRLESSVRQDHSAFISQESVQPKLFPSPIKAYCSMRTDPLFCPRRGPQPRREAL